MSTYIDHHKGTTYTDLHNKLKETVMVSCQPGASTYGVTEQLLKLHNPGNEYYGTFKGSVELCGVPLSGVHLCGVVIENAQLSGKVLLEDGTDIKQLTSDISGINYRIDEFQTEVRKDISDIKAFDEQIELSVKSITVSSDQRIREDLQKLSNDLSSYSNSLCSSLSVETVNNIRSAKAELSSTLSSYANKLCSDISNAVESNGYVDPSGFEFKYVDNFIILRAFNKIGEENELSINSAQFEQNRTLLSVDRTFHDGKFFIELTFELEDKSLKEIEIPVSAFSNIYKAADGIAINEATLELSVNETIARNTYVSANDGFLSAEVLKDIDRVNALSGLVGSLSSDVSAIRLNSIKQLKFMGHVDQPHEGAYGSFEDLIKDQHLNFADLDVIVNGSTIDFEAIDPDKSMSVIDNGEVVKFGKGDFMVIHDHADKWLIDLSSLTTFGEKKNVFMIKSGLSRFEYESISKSLSTEVYVSDDVDLSSWLSNYQDYTQGSIAIIRTSSAGGSTQYSSYVFDKKPTVAFPDGHWEAMNGTYTADSVFFNKDLVLAGSWERIGNVEHQPNTVSSISSTGKSLTEVMEMLTMGKEEFPSKDPKPSFKVSMITATVEYGSSFTPSFQVTFNGGSYKYGSSSNSLPASGTGISTIMFEVAYVDADGNKHESDPKAWLNELTGTSDIISSCNGDTIASAVKSYDANGNVSAYAYYAEAVESTYIPKSSTGRVLSSDDEIAHYRIPSGETHAKVIQSQKISVFKPMYWRVTTSPTSDITEFDAADYPAAWQKDLMAQPRTEFTCPDQWYEVFCLIPAGMKSSWHGHDSNNVDVPVDVTKDVDFTFLNGESGQYKLFIVRNAAPYSKTTVTMTWED